MGSAPSFVRSKVVAVKGHVNEVHPEPSPAAEAPVLSQRGRRYSTRRPQAGSRSSKHEQSRFEDGINDVKGASWAQFYHEMYRPTESLRDFLLQLPADHYPPVLIRGALGDFEALDRAKWDGVHQDDALAIYMYSIELYVESGKSNPHQLYRDMNLAMRDRDPVRIAFWRPMIFYLTKALGRLPCAGAQTLYRGISSAVSPAIYSAGKTVTWPSFSSSTMEAAVASDFLKGAPAVTVFHIQSERPRAIAVFSQFPEEEEFLFPAGSILKVDRVEEEVRIVEGGEQRVVTVYLSDMDMSRLGDVKATFNGAATVKKDGELYMDVQDMIHYMQGACDFVGPEEAVAAEARTLLRGYDRDHDGLISFADFFTYSMAFICFSAEIFEIVFDLYDQGKKGFITAEDITHVVALSTEALGRTDIHRPEVQALLKSEVAQIMEEGDVDKDGRISRQELWQRVVSDNSCTEGLLVKLKNFA
eukprot:GGOE01043248.1.p2 GENE.GGOE01043248.1~~GGOE01043248.1.p2  ORF type:complete len:473 (-),score=149.25 GGOE01043248.1:226-1644(-)